MVSQSDLHHMHAAVALARRGLGRTAENPSVGCVIVHKGIVVGRARTQDGGRPHAEVTALLQAGRAARGATLYVTLEPCSHHGKTPPCVQAIIESGIARVVVGVVDPDERVQGRGIKALMEAGVQTTVGVMEDQCRNVMAGFLSRIRKGRPFVTLKTACTIDGKIATASGESQWITGAQARRHTHFERARHDAILVGIETVLADDPMLNARIDGITHAPMRVVLDRTLRLPIESRLVQSAKSIPVMVFHDSNDPVQIESLSRASVQLKNVSECDIVSVLDAMAESGINAVLVEGGARVHESFLRQGLCDSLLVYRAPTLLGGDAKSVVSSLEIDRLSSRYDYIRKGARAAGLDMIERYEPKVR